MYYPVVPRVRLGTQHKAAYKTKRYKCTTQGGVRRGIKQKGLKQGGVRRGTKQRDLKQGGFGRR